MDEGASLDSAQAIIQAKRGQSFRLQSSRAVFNPILRSHTTIYSSNSRSRVTSRLWEVWSMLNLFPLVLTMVSDVTFLDFTAVLTSHDAGRPSIIRPGKPIFKYVFEQLVNGMQCIFGCKLSLYMMPYRSHLPSNPRHCFQWQSYRRLWKQDTCLRGGVDDPEKYWRRRFFLVGWQASIFRESRLSVQQDVGRGEENREAWQADYRAEENTCERWLSLSYSHGLCVIQFDPFQCIPI